MSHIVVEAYWYQGCAVSICGATGSVTVVEQATVASAQNPLCDSDEINEDLHMFKTCCHTPYQQQGHACSVCGCPKSSMMFDGVASTVGR